MEHELLEEKTKEMSDPTPQATATWRAWTIRLITAFFAIGIGFDALAYHYGGQDATVTQVLRDNSAEWALIPIAVGLIVGHIWWGGYVKRADPAPTESK